VKVLHVGKFYSPHRGGIETHLQSLCEEMRTWVDLEVLVSSPDRLGYDEMVRGVHVKRLPTWLTLASASIGPGLVRAIRSSSADIVHVHVPHPVALFGWLASGHHGKLVITYHSDIVRQRVLGLAFSPFQEAAMARAAAIIVSSPNYLESSRILRKHRNQCTVIPLGVKVEDFDAVDEAGVERIRAEVAGPMILSVGRLVSYKGFEYLIRAMKHVDARLVLIGDGPLRERLRRDAHVYGVAGKILFVPAADDVRPYFHAADIFVLPSVSRAEAFGIVQLEAMACGKPIVNTALDSGVVYVSPDRDTGLTVTPCDSDGLATAINALLRDPRMRLQMGAAARRRVEQLFTVDRMARHTLAVYERVLSS
jgi:rhamnosyl/mannosyltransferase